MRDQYFDPVALSLEDLLGGPYLDAVCAARAWCSGEEAAALRVMAARKLDCFPLAMQERLGALLPHIGTRVVPAMVATAPGASTEQFTRATHADMAPLTGFGYYRVGENGRLYFISKSEHYHVPLGHAFPGYRLLEHARQLGIPNATHNNTRGYITRRLEEALVRAAGGTLDRVLNLQTGSLATEAALKMMLARFYQSQGDAPAPVYGGRTPVVVVMGDDQGAPAGNYHGTAMLTQMLRGMWPQMAAQLEAQGTLLVRAVRPNCLEDARELFATYDRPPYKIAGFFHEIVMMNYGARLLRPEFLTEVYALCRAHDVPVLADEIQSCMWHPRHFLFRDYDLAPDFVAVGKGFPGGEFASSRLIFNARYDCLPQFGALVTNGQEELSSLAYLVSMRWAQANAERIRAVGDYYADRLAETAQAHPDVLIGCDGLAHLSALRFAALESAVAFARAMNARGFDISAQTYKADCPPVVLTKAPIIMGYDAADRLVEAIRDTLREVAACRVTP